jgi:hypothetical protein
MRLGIGYNLFNGEEILPYSLRSIRAAAEHVSVVYQAVSNYGSPCDPALLPLLEQLRSEGLVDELIAYATRLGVHPHYNEIAKRNRGLQAALAAGCTHYMSMDADEVYRPEQLAWAKEEIEREDWPGSVCLSATYYRSPRYRLVRDDPTYFPMLFKLTQASRFALNAPFPVLADPTRKMVRDRIRIFERNEVELHHYSYVRRDLRIKLANSVLMRTHHGDEIERIAEHCAHWRPGQRALLHGAWSDVTEVEPLIDFDLESLAQA